MTNPAHPTLSNGQLLLTTEEAAEILRIGRTTVYALISDGALHPVHIGRACRISRAELERYVQHLEAAQRPKPSASFEVPSLRQRVARGDSTNQPNLFDSDASSVVA